MRHRFGHAPSGPPSARALLREIEGEGEVDPEALRDLRRALPSVSWSFLPVGPAQGARGLPFQRSGDAGLDSGKRTWNEWGGTYAGWLY